jgi:hypothetical protein
LDPDLDPDPEPLVRGTDPGIRIRTKMSRIPDTASHISVQFCSIYVERYLHSCQINAKVLVTCSFTEELFKGGKKKY